MDPGHAIVVPFKILTHEHTNFKRTRFDVMTEYREIRVMKRQGEQISDRYQGLYMHRF